MFRSLLRRLAGGVLAYDRIAIVSDGIQLRSNRAGSAGARLFEKFPNLFVRNLSLSNLLMGGENGHSAASYARLTDEILRPSTPIARSPHVDFLRDYLAVGEAIFGPERFSETRYWKNAQECIALSGQYFGANSLDGVTDRARRFARMLEGERIEVRDVGATAGGLPVRVRRIKFSDCYEVVDGNHRLAVASVRGARSYPCGVMPVEPSITPAQQMIMDSSWTEGSRLLRQPIELPELRSWSVMGRCDDHLDMMMSVLQPAGLQSGSYLDIGCGYGWFVDQMSKRGYQAAGIDRDAAAVAVGSLAYGLEPAAIVVDDVARFLRAATRCYDIVTCFGPPHRQAPATGTLSLADYMGLVDRVTGSVLFLDTGEGHENWFKECVKDANAESIEGWLKQHTSFRSVQVLGAGGDGKGRHRDRHGRHLFACRRTEGPDGARALPDQDVL